MSGKCNAGVDVGVGYGDGEITATDVDRGDGATSLRKDSGTSDRDILGTMLCGGQTVQEPMASSSEKCEVMLLDQAEEAMRNNPFYWTLLMFLEHPAKTKDHVTADRACDLGKCITGFKASQQ